jgi:ABC-type uncharacterized transport system permease subunit
MPMLMHIKLTLDLLGLNVAFEEILQVEAWTKVEGKEKISIILFSIKLRLMQSKK